MRKVISNVIIFILIIVMTLMPVSALVTAETGLGGAVGGVAAAAAYSGVTAENNTQGIASWAENLYNGLSPALQLVFSAWALGDALIMTPSEWEEFNDAIDDSFINDAYTINLSANNILYYSNPEYVRSTLTYNKSSSSLTLAQIYNDKSVNYNIAVGEYVYLSSTIRASLISYNSSYNQVRFEIYSGSVWSNASGYNYQLGTETKSQLYDKDEPVYVSFLLDASGYIHMCFHGEYNNAFASIDIKNSSSSYPVQIASINDAVQAYAAALGTSNITYNVYAPPTDEYGNVELTLPVGVTWGDILGRTGDDVLDITGTGEGSTANQTTYDEVLGEINLGIGSIGTILGTIAGSIGSSISSIVSNGLTAIQSAIAALTAAFADPFGWSGNTPNIPSGIGGFFPGILALLAAIMALFGKVIIFIGNLYNISATSSMLHPTMIQGLEWARGFETSGGVNLYGLITGIISVVLGLVVFKLVRKMIAGIGTASPYRSE